VLPKKLKPKHRLSKPNRPCGRRAAPKLPAAKPRPTLPDPPADELPEAPIAHGLSGSRRRTRAANHAGVDIVRGENGLYLVPLAFVEFPASRTASSSWAAGQRRQISHGCRGFD
jgi:hypothetical protein